MREKTNNNRQLCLKNKFSNNCLITTYYHVWVLVSYKVSTKLKLLLLLFIYFFVLMFKD